ncbi:MAG: TonB-dependent receptor [Pseudomonadota bacterium]
MVGVGKLGLRAFAVGALTASTALVMPAIATAQNADTQIERGATLLQRLIVGFGEPKVATDTPQAVTVIDQEDIDREVPGTVADLIEKAPGVTATGNGDNLIGQNFNIRGFGPQEVGSNQEGRVQVNVDGATKYYESYRMGGFFGDSELYKRVEVLRGPASGTLYGTSVLGGVINITTKDASDFLDDGDTGALRVKGTYDSNQEGFKASAILALRMGENAEFLAAANYTDLNNIVTGDGTEMIGTANEFPSGLVKGTFYLDEAKERVLRASYNHTQTDGETAVAVGGDPVCNNPLGLRPAPPCFPTDGVTNPPSLVDRFASDRTFVLSYEDAATDNPWLDLKVNASWSELRNEQSPFIDADLSYTYYELSVSNTFEWISDNYENYLTVGLDGKYHQRRRDDLDGTPVTSHPEGNERYVGLYAQNEFVYDDRLTLIGGLRVDWRELEPTGSTLTENLARRGAPPNVVQRSVLPTSVSDIAFAPKIAAIYGVADGLNVFGSYAYGERLPGIDEEFDWNGDNVQNFLDKETSHTFEAGLSGDIDGIFTPDDTFSYKLTGFYTALGNRIVRDDDDITGADGVADYINQGSGRIYGVEVEAAYDSEFFFASTYASLIRGDDTTRDVALGSIPPDELGFTIGGKLPQYDIRFGWDARFVANETRVPVSVNPRFTNDVAASTRQEEFRRRGFNTHDIWLTWKPDDGPLEGVDASVRVDNITDEFYQEFLSTAGPAKGRTFKAALGYTLKF